MSFPSLTANLKQVRERVADIQDAAGLSQRVRIIAVTKGHPGAAVMAAIEAGVTDVGENRVQEALRKQDELGHVRVAWHLIGHLQTNKAKAVAGRFAAVHSVDSLRVAEVLEAANLKRGVERLDVLLQVNVAGEEQKTGCNPDDASDIAHAITAFETLRLQGLMTMAPFTDDESVQRSAFSRLRAMREHLEGEGLALPELSMGMSNDYTAAVAEGATMLRLGTVLFGERPR
jgi:pyridoxal phosphate enzyme (YggS family)